MKRVLMGLSLTALLFLVPEPRLAMAAGPWHAQIVDAETKQPLEGVVVVAVWSKNVRSLGGPSGEYYDSEEVVTDREGRFMVQPRRFFSLNPLVYFKGPEFTIFKPGYGEHVWPEPKEVQQWPEEKRRTALATWGNLLQLDGIVLEMPRLRTLAERKKYIGEFTMPTDLSMNREKIPLLVKAIAEERRAVGFRK